MGHRDYNTVQQRDSTIYSSLWTHYCGLLTAIKLVEEKWVIPKNEGMDTSGLTAFLSLPSPWKPTYSSIGHSFGEYIKERYTYRGEYKNNQHLEDYQKVFEKS